MCFVRCDDGTPATNIVNNIPKVYFEKSLFFVPLRIVVTLTLTSTSHVTRHCTFGCGDGHKGRRERSRGGHCCPPQPPGDADGALKRQAAHGSQVGCLFGAVPCRVVPSGVVGWC